MAAAGDPDAAVTQTLELVQSGACAATYRWSIKGLMEAIDHHCLPVSIYSEPVDIDGVPWRFLVYPNGNGVRSLSLYVDLANSHALPPGWSRVAVFSFSVVNRRNPQATVANTAEKVFFLGLQDWGFRHVLPLADLYADDGGFIVDDILVIEASVSVSPASRAPAEDERRDSDDATPRASGSVGLCNQGATCYLNSLIQTLFHISFLRGKVYSAPVGDVYDPVSSEEEDDELPVLQKKVQKPPPPPPVAASGGGGPPADPNLVGALQQVFYNMQFQRRPVSTTELTTAFGWGTDEVVRQHDIHELIRVLCAALDERFKGTKVAGILDSLFRGVLTHSIVCQDIDFERVTEEAFFDLQLNVRGCATVADAFDAYFAPEVLDGSNSYHAGNEGLQKATRYTKLTKTPPVLVLQLKRFDFDVKLRKQTKVNDRQEFPLELDLSPYLSPGVLASSPHCKERLGKYLLVSILVHSGDVNAGHYYSFIRPGMGATWYRFDDERVFRVADKDAIEENYGGEYGGGHLPRFSSAYVLTYLRAADVHWLVPSIGFKNVPRRVHRRFGRAGKDDSDRQVAEAHLYVTVKILTNAGLHAAGTFGAAVVEPIRFLRKDTFGALLRTARAMMEDEVRGGGGDAATAASTASDATATAGATSIAASLLTAAAAGSGAHPPPPAVTVWRMQPRLNRSLRPSERILCSTEAPLERAFGLGLHHKDAIVVYVQPTPRVSGLIAPDEVVARLAAAATTRSASPATVPGGGVGSSIHTVPTAAPPSPPVGPQLFDNESRAAPSRSVSALGGVFGAESSAPADITVDVADSPAVDHDATVTGAGIVLDSPLLRLSPTADDSQRFTPTSDEPPATGSSGRLAAATTTANTARVPALHVHVNGGGSGGDAVAAVASSAADTAARAFPSSPMALNSRLSSRHNVGDILVDGSVNVFSASAGCVLLFVKTYDACASEKCGFVGRGFAVHRDITLGVFINAALGVPTEGGESTVSVYEDVRDGVLEALDLDFTVDDCELSHGDVIVVDYGRERAAANNHPCATGAVTPPVCEAGLRETVRSAVLTMPVGFAAMEQPDSVTTLHLPTTCTIEQVKPALAEALQLPPTTSVEIHRVGADYLPLPNPLPPAMDIATALAFGWNAVRKELHYAVHKTAAMGPGTPRSPGRGSGGSHNHSHNPVPTGSGHGHDHASSASGATNPATGSGVGGGDPAGAYTGTLQLTLVSRVHGEVQEALKVPFPDHASVGLLKWQLLEEYLLLGPDGAVGAAAMSEARVAALSSKRASSRAAGPGSSLRSAGGATAIRSNLHADRPRVYRLCRSTGVAAVATPHEHPFEKRVLLFEMSVRECAVTQVLWDGGDAVVFPDLGYALCAEVACGDVDIDPGHVSFEYAPGLSGLPNFQHACSLSACQLAPPSTEWYLVEVVHAELDPDDEPNDNLAAGVPTAHDGASGMLPNPLPVLPHSTPWLTLVKAKDTVQDVRARLLKERPMLSALQKFLKDPKKAIFHVSPIPLCCAAEPLAETAPVLAALADARVAPRAPSLCLIRPPTDRLKVAEDKQGPGIAIRTR